MIFQCDDQSLNSAEHCDMESIYVIGEKFVKVSILGLPIISMTNKFIY